MCKGHGGFGGWYRVVVLAALCGGSAASMRGQRSLAEALQMRAANVSPGAMRARALSALEDAAVAPPESTEDALHTLATAAGVIFVGEVTKVRDGGGYREVEFSVEEGVRGAETGVPYVMREWSGLAQGKMRYRVGQRLLVLLHAPSVAGLSSPMGGTDGLIPMHGRGITAEVDMRWIATHVRRAEMAANGMGIKNLRALPTARPLAMKNASVAGIASGDVAEVLERPVVERTLVVSLLREWERQRVVAEAQR